MASIAELRNAIAIRENLIQQKQQTRTNILRTEPNLFLRDKQARRLSQSIDRDRAELDRLRSDINRKQEGLATVQRSVLSKSTPSKADANLRRVRERAAFRRAVEATGVRFTDFARQQSAIQAFKRELNTKLAQGKTLTASDIVPSTNLNLSAEERGRLILYGLQKAEPQINQQLLTEIEKRAKESPLPPNIFQIAQVQTQRPQLLFTGRQLRGTEKLQTQLFQASTQFARKNTYSNKLLSAGAAFLGQIVKSVDDTVKLPQTLNEIRKNPSLLLTIPEVLRTSFNTRARLFKTNPGEAIAITLADVVVFRATNRAIEAITSVANNARVLSPLFRGVVRAGSVVPIKIKGKTFNVTVVRKLPRERLAAQIARAGTRVNAVSAQADALVRLLRRQRTVKKPTGGTLDAQTRQLLAKLDAGRITKKELSTLNQRLRKSGSKGVLERSFFADPAGRLRLSRLGIGAKRARLIDWLTGDITFKTPKPQVLFFPGAKVSKFPASLQTIIQKIRTGKRLTKAEELRLVQFQLKRTGTFKPVGFVSNEAEVTLAPGEIIQRVRTVATIRANGTFIPIVQARVVPIPKNLRSLVTKFRQRKITAAELRELNRRLARFTGFDYSLTMRSKRLVNLRSMSLTSALTFAKYRGSSSRRGGVGRSVRKGASPSVVKRGSPRFSVMRGSLRGTSRITTSRAPPRRGGRGSTSKSGKSGAKRRIPAVSRPIGGARGGRVVRQPRLQNKKDESKGQAGYDVYVRAGRRLRKINAFALTRTDANRYLRYILENSTSASGIIKKSRQKAKVVQGIPATQASHFRSRKRKSKLDARSVIEKRKYRINTRGEKSQLKAAQVAKKLSRRIRRR